MGSVDVHDDRILFCLSAWPIRQRAQDGRLRRRADIFWKPDGRFQLTATLDPVSAKSKAPTWW
jgi:hypothetical protein